MTRTLLLSSGYEPLATISWQRAICLWTVGKVEVVREYERAIRSMRLVVKMPSVVRLTHTFRRPKKVVKFSRQNVLTRDRWKCQYCGLRKPSQELTYDHVIPKAQGGRTCWENIVIACVACNHQKANRTPAEARMRLTRKPTRPAWTPMYGLQISLRSIPDAWRDYLYWTVELSD